nr:uncharacterized protein K02A2.6-like [Arachis hypogaea]
MEDSKEFVKKCVKCQENANFHRAPATKLSLLMSSRPSAQWGVDLLGPLPVGPGQIKYLIVAIDHYTKWIEAKPLATISSSNCRKFMWRQVITRFGIPEVVISDNGTQFTDKKFVKFLTGLGIKQKFSSVEHPQTNGQVESANKVILLGLKKRLDNKKRCMGRRACLSPLVLPYNRAVCHGRNPLPPDIRGRRNDTRRDRQAEPTVTSQGGGRSGREGPSR